MVKRNNARTMLAMIICLALFACNQQKKTEEPTTTTGDTTATSTKTEMESMPGYDASMDPTKMTNYPATILADSLGMKLYEFVAKPGDSIPLHSHPDHALYVVQGGKADITGKDGKTQTMELQTGQGVIFGPEMHSAKNTGTTTLKLVIVHVYRPRS